MPIEHGQIIDFLILSFFSPAETLFTTEDLTLTVCTFTDLVTMGSTCVATDYINTKKCNINIVTCMMA